MRDYIWVFLALLFLLSTPALGQTCAVPSDPEESKHFLFGRPIDLKPSERETIHVSTFGGDERAYELNHNTHTKFADWVAYCLDPIISEQETRPGRQDFANDPDIPNEFEIKHDHYNCAQWLIGYDRGHQAPRAAFKGLSNAFRQPDIVTNISPQNAKLNQRGWKALEDTIRAGVLSGNVVYVITGPIYERLMPALPDRNNPPDHIVPSGFWKIVAMGNASQPDLLKAVAFYFDQERGHIPTPIATEDLDWGPTFRAHQVSIDEIELRTGYDFFPDLHEDFELPLEHDLNDIEVINLDAEFSDSDPNINQNTCPARSPEQEAQHLIFGTSPIEVLDTPDEEGVEISDSAATSIAGLGSVKIILLISVLSLIALLVVLLRR